MRKVSMVLLMVMMAFAVNCNVNVEFMNKVKGLMSGGVNAGPYINGCENHHNFFAYDFPVDQRDHYAGLAQSFHYLRGTHQRNLFAIVSKMRYTKQSVEVVFENHIQANGVSGVLAKATVAQKVGSTIYARAGIGSATCGMTQLFKTETYTARRMLCNNGPTTHTRTVPRGFEPHELVVVQDHLQQQSAQTLYDIGRHHTGVGADESALTSLYVAEARKLRRWFREITYQYSEMEDVPHHELPAAVRESSFHQVNDGWVHERIKQVAASSGRSAFFHAPSNDVICVVAINRVGDNFNVHVSSFIVHGAMPGGAFAWSTGGWNLERGGRGTNPSVHDLMHTFPALK